jgi:hypothetical protein
MWQYTICSSTRHAAVHAMQQYVQRRTNAGVVAAAPSGRALRRGVWATPSSLVRKRHGPAATLAQHCTPAASANSCAGPWCASDSVQGAAGAHRTVARAPRRNSPALAMLCGINKSNVVGSIIMTCAEVQDGACGGAGRGVWRRRTGHVEARPCARREATRGAYERCVAHRCAAPACERCAQAGPHRRASWVRRPPRAHLPAHHTHC